MNITITGSSFDHISVIYKSQWWKLYRKYYLYLFVLILCGAWFLYHGIQMTAKGESIWNGPSACGAVMAGIGLFSLIQASAAKRRGIENAEKVVAHKNALPGEWTLQIFDDHITYKDAEIDTEQNWSCFESFNDLSEYVIVHSYNLSAPAFVVQKEKLKTEELTELLLFCREHLKENK